MRMNEKRRALLRVFVVLMLFSGLVMSCDKDGSNASLNAPFLAEAPNITSSSFRIVWGQVSGADKYVLDISTDAEFATTIAGYDKKPYATTNTTVTGLSAATKYYFRVFAKEGEVLSESSEVREVTTKP